VLTDSCGSKVGSTGEAVSIFAADLSVSSSLVVLTLMPMTAGALLPGMIYDFFKQIQEH
jgi:hypothetical protein